MTADFFHFDMEFLGRVANRIVNEVRGINRVVYDVTSKPPARSSGSEGSIERGQSSKIKRRPTLLSSLPRSQAGYRLPIV